MAKRQGMFDVETDRFWNWNPQLRIDKDPGCWYVAILLLVDQYATVVHAGGHRYFSGDIRRVSHLASGNDYPLRIRQDARALVLLFMITVTYSC